MSGHKERIFGVGGFQNPPVLFFFLKLQQPRLHYLSPLYTYHEPPLHPKPSIPRGPKWRQIWAWSKRCYGRSWLDICKGIVETKMKITVWDLVIIG